MFVNLIQLVACTVVVLVLRSMPRCAGFAVKHSALPIVTWWPVTTTSCCSSRCRSANTAASLLRCAAPVQEDETTSTSIGSLGIQEFTTKPMKVYIEDTDAYGVVYNANYLKFYDRALHQTSFDKKMDDDQDNNNNDKHYWNMMQHDGWSIVGVKSMRYKQSPPLGGSFVIHGALVHTSSDQQPFLETWDLSMTSVDGRIVYNTAEGLQIARPAATSTRTSWLPQSETPILRANQVINSDNESRTKGDNVLDINVAMDAFDTYRDEFDPHLTTHLPLTRLLHFWERARSNVLGGPDALRQLQVQDNILLVVTGNQHLALLMEEQNDTGISVPHAQQSLIRPGESVTVETVVVWKRRRVMAEFHQSTWSPSGQCLGQGITTILAIDAATRRPARRLPSWVFVADDGKC